MIVPSFDDLFVIAGQGTVGLEAARQLEEADARADLLACCVSGGGLIAGIALAFEALSPGTAIWSAEPNGYACSASAVSSASSTDSGSSCV